MNPETHTEPKAERLALPTQAERAHVDNKATIRRGLEPQADASADAVAEPPAAGQAWERNPNPSRGEDGPVG